MSSAPLRLGIVGLGRMGKRHAENALRRIDGARLTAAASLIDSERAWASAQGIEFVYSSLEELLENAPVDAVLLATPTALHAEQSIAVLKAGKHLLVEKPLALSVADCERVETVYAQTRQIYPKQIAMVGFVRRFDASYMAAKEAILRGEIGRVLFVRSQTCDKYDESGFFIAFSPSSGGIIMDCNIHDIDLVRWFLTENNETPTLTQAVTYGSASVHPALEAHQDADNVISQLRFNDGRFAQLYASRTFAHGHETSTEIIGTQGKLLIGQGAVANCLVKSDATGVQYRAYHDFIERFEQAFVAQLQAFVAACQGQIAAPLTLQDATEATRIGVALTQSMRTLSPVVV